MNIPARREFKYLFEPARVPLLRRAIEPWCRRDPNAGPDGTYRLRSLYFDAPDLRLFHANEREASRRYKARLRWYPDDRQAPVFAEIKARSGDVILKSRGRLSAEGWRRELDGPTSDPGLGAFQAKLHRDGLSPISLVEYRREAWQALDGGYARVSVDTRVRCQRVDRLTLDGRPDAWRPIDHRVMTITNLPICVLELKWAQAPPRWMVNLVQRLELSRQSFSKYCHSMVALAADHHPVPLAAAEF